MDPVDDDPTLAGVAVEGEDGPVLLTAQQWRRFMRARRAWDRRAVVATGAVILAEVAACIAWTAWTSAMSAPRPRAGA